MRKGEESCIYSRRSRRTGATSQDIVRISYWLLRSDDEPERWTVFSNVMESESSTIYTANQGITTGRGGAYQIYRDLRAAISRRGYAFTLASEYDDINDPFIHVELQMLMKDLGMKLLVAEPERRLTQLMSPEELETLIVGHERAAPERMVSIHLLDTPGWTPISPSQTTNQRPSVSKPKKKQNLNIDTRPENGERLFGL